MRAETGENCESGSLFFYGKRAQTGAGPTAFDGTERASEGGARVPPCGRSEGETSPTRKKELFEVCYFAACDFDWRAVFVCCPDCPVALCVCFVFECECFFGAGFFDGHFCRELLEAVGESC